MADRYESPVAAWFVSGKNPKGYEAGAGHIRSKEAGTPGFVTIMTQAPADRWRGQRVRLRAEVRGADVAGWTGLWMRVDGASPAELLAFDNMQERALRGTVAWTPCEIVLDVDASASAVLFGLILTGDGEAWVRSASVEVVDADTPITEVRPSIRGVILDENLEAFLTTVAWIVGDDLDSEDWTAVRAAVDATDEAGGRWYDVPAFTARSCRVALARDAGVAILHVKVELPRRWRIREAGLAMEIFGFFAAKRALRRPRGDG